jgi:hypothetical protein
VRQPALPERPIEHPADPQGREARWCGTACGTTHAGTGGGGPAPPWTIHHQTSFVWSPRQNKRIKKERKKIYLGQHNKIINFHTHTNYLAQIKYL